MKAESRRRERGSKAKQRRGLSAELQKIKQQHENAFSTSREQRETSSLRLQLYIQPPPLPHPTRALGSISNADGSSYENTAFYAGCLLEEMLRHDSWLELQGGVSLQS